MPSQHNSTSQIENNVSFPQSKELCRAVFEHTSDGIFVANRQGLIVQVSQQLCDMLGYTTDEMLSLFVGDIVLNSNTNTPLHCIENIGNTDNQSEQYSLRHKEGTLLEAELCFQSLSEGSIVGLVRDFGKQNRIEEQFHESEQRFRLLAESSLTGIYLIMEGQFDYVNTAFAHMFGYEVEEVINNLKMTDLIFPEDRPLVLENIRRRVEGKEDSVRYVFRGWHKNRSIIYVEVHGRRINHKGKIGVIGTLIDITDTKKAEVSLRASEERYRSLYNENPSMFFTLDTDGVISAVNDFGANQLGYSREELEGQSFLNLLKKDDIAVARDRFKACLHTHGQVHHWQLRKIRKDGNPLWVDEYMRATTGPDGSVNVLAVCQDITERIQLEESLKVSQFIFDQAAIGIFLIRDDNLIIDVNEYACRNLGYSKEELCNRSVMDIDPAISADQLEELRSQLDAVKSATIQTIHRRKNGEIFPVQVFISTLPYKNNVFRVCFVQDISEIEQARIEQDKLEAQLKQVQKLEAVGRLAGGVAHDLNNLLTPILGYSDLLAIDKNISGHTKAKLAQISKAATGARDLVKQLLAFSRKQVLEYQPIYLNTIVENFDSLIRRTIRENIEIRVSTSSDLKPVMADCGQIEQVLMNLIVNASDAMPNGGKLSIETKMTELDEIYTATHPDVTPGTYVMLGISDTGEGIDEENLSKIFEPFFSTKGDQGTGLGLATIYGIVKQHKGSVWVYSEPGMGTNFKIYLPAATQLPEPDSPQHEKKSNTHGSETILLVEDNEAVRTTVHDILKEQGYRVITAKDGKSALLKVVSGITFDMLLTDVVMPDMNGKELFTRISTRIPLVKVLYMSGYTDDIIVHHGVLEKGIQFIQKPFSSLEILQKVRTVLDS